MKKLWYVLTAIITLLIFSTFFKNNKLNPENPVSLQDELGQTPLLDKSKKYSADFAICDKNKGFSINDAAGSTKLKIIGAENEDCMVDIIYDINGGSYTNTCRIPKSIGNMIFENNNFDKLSAFCALKTPENAE